MTDITSLALFQSKIVMLEINVGLGAIQEILFGQFFLLWKVQSLYSPQSTTKTEFFALESLLGNFPQSGLLLFLQTGPEQLDAPLVFIMD